jgi:hypothetical protein
MHPTKRGRDDPILVLRILEISVARASPLALSVNIIR